MRRVPRCVTSGLDPRTSFENPLLVCLVFSSHTPLADAKLRERNARAQLKTAGYLLSVAFKIDGKIPPDKIQQVKDHKAMMKDMGKLKDATKESAAKAQTALASATTSLNVWLDGVDLPPVGDKAYDPRSLPVCAQPATGPCMRESLMD